MQKNSCDPSTLFGTDDRFEQGKGLLLLGWSQQEIAEQVGMSEGSVSNYHQALEDGDAFPPAEAYKLARQYLRRLDKAGLPISDAEDVLGAINELRNVQVVPEDESDALSIREVAEIAAVAAALNDGDVDKHDIAVEMSKLCDLEDRQIESADVKQEGNPSGTNQIRSLGEITSTDDAEPRKRRTLSEAVRAKGEMLN